MGGYTILPKRANFTQAQANCKAMGVALASIHNHEDLVEVQTLCNNDISNHLCWIGGQHD